MTINAKAFFSDEREKKAYVEEAELRFETALDSAVLDLLADGCERIITLSGPTCAGKTTAASKLVRELSERGKHVQVVSLDDFFYGRKILHEKARSKGLDIDFDSPDAIDFEALSSAVSDILKGNSIRMPIFNFKKGERDGYRSFTPSKDDVFLFEGIQAIYPEVTALLDGHAYRSIYISVQSGIRQGDACFEPHTVRLARRLVRDYLFRGAGPDFTFFLWESVRQNEEKNILPYAHTANVMLDTTLPYEMSMLKPYLMPLLDQIGETDLYYHSAKKLRQQIEHVAEIDVSYLPEHSLYHEFLG